jgi:fumarylacetoacetate (FAA) hydrolase
MTWRWAAITRRRPRARIRLVMLVNDVSLRGSHPGRARQGLRLFPVEAGFGLLARRGDAGRTRAPPGPASANWHLPLHSAISTAILFGQPGCGDGHDLRLSATLIAHAAKTRSAVRRQRSSARAPSPTGAQMAGRGKLVQSDGGRGYSCIAERRMVEHDCDRRQGVDALPGNQGDRVRIEMLDAAPGARSSARSTR